MTRTVPLATMITAACCASAAFADGAATSKPLGSWDIAFGGGVYSDYIYRGISQSNHRPAINVYVEPRYNLGDNLQLYAGFGGWSVSYPNRAPTEVDVFAGVRPTFGSFEFDFGVWYLYYPGGQCFNSVLDVNGRAFGADCFLNGDLPINGNTSKADFSYAELFARATWHATDRAAIGGAFIYMPDWANIGANAAFVSAYVKLTAPSDWMPPGIGAAVSAEIGRHWFGTTDAFSCTAGSLISAAAVTNPPAVAQCGGPVPPVFPLATPYPNGTPLPGYATWNVGLSVTFNVFTLDLRYYNTTLSEADCNVLTGDINATFSRANINALNPNGFGSKLCSQSFVLSLSAALTSVINK